MIGGEFVEARVEINVRYSETDQMGVVYHGNYFPWYDQARFELIKKLGYDVKELEGKGLLMPVIEVNCKYRKSARFGDNLVIVAKLDPKYTNKLVVDFQVIRKAEGEILAEARTCSVLVNRQGQIIPKKLFKLRR